MLGNQFSTVQVPKWQSLKPYYSNGKVHDMGDSDQDCLGFMSLSPIFRARNSIQKIKGTKINYGKHTHTERENENRNYCILSREKES